MQPYRYIADIDSEFTNSPQANVISLKEFCANKLVSHGVLSFSVCRKLPHQFFNLFIQCAMQHNSETSVTALLDAWRNELFTFEIPDYMKKWEVYFWDHILNLRRKLLKKHHFLPFIVDRVIDSLTSDCESECRIRCLDFSYFPIQDLPLHNLYRLLIARCDTFARSKERNHVHELVIKITAIVDFKEDLSALCQTLSHLKDSNSVLNLQVTAVYLAVVCIHEDVLQLLDLIDPEALNAFKYSQNVSGENERHNFALLRKLRSCSNLKTLSFRLAEFHDCEYRGRIFFELNDLFSQLQNLKHLTLDNVFYLRPIQISEFEIDQSSPSKLSFMSEHLESLLLTGCRISAEDVKYFNQFPRDLALKSLSLTRCQVDLQSLVCLLTSCKNLRDLCLRRCEYSGGKIDLLFQTLPAMENLEYLKIRDMQMSPEALMAKTGCISRMPRLKYLSISPIWSFLEGVTVHNFQESFHHALEMLWNNT